MALTRKTSAREKPSSLWWLASLVFHALLLGWLVFFPPVLAIDFAAKKNAAVSPARAEEVMQQVREQQADKLAGDVQALADARREIAQLEAGQREQLRRATTNNPEALEKVVAAQQDAFQAQIVASNALIQAQVTLKSELAQAAPVLTNLTSEVRTAQEGANQNQSQALETLALADARYEPAYQAQAEANVAQSRAAQAQAEAEGELSGAAAFRTKYASKQDDLAKAQDALHSVETQLADAVSSATAASNHIQQADQNVAKATAASDGTKASGKNIIKAQKEADNARKTLNRAISDIPKFQQRVSDQKERVAKFSGVGGAAASNPADIARAAGKKLMEAQQLQGDAIVAQTQAAKIFSQIQNGGASVAKSADAAPPKAGDLAGVYQAAVNGEAEMAETYRRLRATQLAMQRQIPLAQALELTDVARPERPDLAAALSSAPTNGLNLAAQREAVQDARSQIMAMRALADSMLVQARGPGAASGKRQPALDQLATEDDNQRAKDLTGAMTSNLGSAAGNPGAASGKGGTGSGSAGSGGSGSGGNGTAGGSGVGAGARAVSKSGGDGTSSGPPPVPKDLSAVPGRVIGANAVAGRWMFVDSWYLLGPFDNTGRVNLNKQFPPETVVDLNATYVGKRGQPASWEFYQSAQPDIVPPFEHFASPAAGEGDSFKARDLEYIIYYGYTEIRAVVACDVWIAVGSDDFSKVWINDQLVWASGTQQKNWRVDEGFRKVRLKSGVNRVLFRVENGHADTKFSLAISKA